jgi:hypothetical protein
MQVGKDFWYKHLAGVLSRSWYDAPNNYVQFDSAKGLSAAIIFETASAPQGSNGTISIAIGMKL